MSRVRRERNLGVTHVVKRQGLTNRKYKTGDLSYYHIASVTSLAILNMEATDVPF